MNITASNEDELIDVCRTEFAKLCRYTKGAGIQSLRGNGNMTWVDPGEVDASAVPKEIMVRFEDDYEPEHDRLELTVEVGGMATAEFALHRIGLADELQLYQVEVLF